MTFTFQQRIGSITKSKHLFTRFQQSACHLSPPKSQHWKIRKEEKYFLLHFSPSWCWSWGGVSQMRSFYSTSGRRTNLAWLHRVMVPASNGGDCELKSLCFLSGQSKSGCTCTFPSWVLKALGLKSTGVSLCRFESCLQFAESFSLHNTGDQTKWSQCFLLALETGILFASVLLASLSIVE